MRRYYLNEALLHVARALAQAQDYSGATKVAERITDGIKRAKVLVETSLAALKSGMISVAIDIASAININQEIHLYTIMSAIIESESSERDQFKRLLIPCAYYVNLAYRVCGLLAKVHPNQSEQVSNPHNIITLTIWISDSYFRYYCTPGRVSLYIQSRSDCLSRL